MVNIPTFGVCKCSYPPPSCAPSPQSWQMTAKKDHVESMLKLTMDSFCLCAKGGKISFVDSGKNTFVNIIE